MAGMRVNICKDGVRYPGAYGEALLQAKPLGSTCANSVNENWYALQNSPIKIHTQNSTNPCLQVRVTHSRAIIYLHKIRDENWNYVKIWDSHSGGYQEAFFWEIMPCSPLKINRYFGGTCLLHLQGRRMSKKSGWKQVAGRIYCYRIYPTLRHIKFYPLHPTHPPKIKLQI
jgi:hypothetical protein